MLISEIRDEVSQELLGFAWRQWAQVGVSATIEGADRWAVDPEALILFTIGISTGWRSIMNSCPLSGCGT
jgi:hypothetical protein